MFSSPLYSSHREHHRAVVLIWGRSIGVKYVGDIEVLATYSSNTYSQDQLRSECTVSIMSVFHTVNSSVPGGLNLESVCLVTLFGACLLFEPAIKLPLWIRVLFKSGSQLSSVTRPA